MKTFCVQTWTDKDQHDDIEALSLDAAREIARAHCIIGNTVRIMADDEDYCEVWTINGWRAGTFGETTMVRT